MSSLLAPRPSTEAAATLEVGWPRWVGPLWAGFVVASLLLLGVVTLPVWAGVVGAAAVGLGGVTVAVVRDAPWVHPRADVWDLVAVVGIYAGVVGLFRLAFVGFTQENVAGLFLSFAAGLLLGTVGPIAYTTWWRRRPLASLGLGRHNLRTTAGLAVVFASVQFVMTLWGYELPAPVDWVPLLVMSLVVGLFEAIFFRGFVQGRLEASFGIVAGVLGGAALYSLYHVGYGMPVDELWFLFGLGIVYAVAYRLVENVFVLWPLLTPLGAFFNNLEAGDIELPWASIAGFADVLAVMALILWLAARHQRRHPPLPHHT